METGRERDPTEEALRRYLLLSVLERAGERADLDEEEALRLAYDEIRAARP